VLKEIFKGKTVLPNVKKINIFDKTTEKLIWHELCFYRGDSEMRQNSTVEEL